jgi:hypothetical protein
MKEALRESTAPQLLIPKEPSEPKQRAKRGAEKKWNDAMCSLQAPTNYKIILLSCIAQFLFDLKRVICKFARFSPSRECGCGEIELS